MDGSADLSKILGIIMENPEIIEKIKQMASGNEKTEATSATEEAIADQPPKTEPATASPSEASEASAATRGRDKKRRHDLLCAIKPYVSAERSRAIDTMLSVVEVLEIMKAR